MKKTIMTTLVASSLLLAWNTYADSEMMTTTTLVDPIPAVTNIVETGSTTSELTEKYDLIIRNNNILSDDEFNNKTYYTKKITTENLIVPEEISKTAKRIYFLVEEWYSRIFYNKEMWGMDRDEAANVKQEYNYKTVDFTAWKKEYIFNTADLVKDFSKGEYKSVTITLVAEFSDTEKLYLSNMAYINVADKASILDNLKYSKDPTWSSYYGYFSPESLWDYLDKLWEKMTREEYKKTLIKVQTKLKTLVTKNEASKKVLLDSIKKESDFEANLDKYTLYTETNNLLMNVSSATINQLQKLRSYDLIDSVFWK